MKKQFSNRTLFLFFILYVFSGINIQQAKAEYFLHNSSLNSSDTNNITLDQKIKVEDLFKYISEFTKYTFFYSSELEELQKVIYINVNEASVSEVLEEAFKQVPLEYQFDGIDIIIRKVNIENNNQTQSTRKIAGCIVDQSGVPLMSVTVYVKNTSTGTISDEDGCFSIDMQDDQTLVISHLGFNSEEVLYSGQSYLDITLTESREMLDDVVVVGYGSQKIKDVTGSLSYIKRKEIEDSPVLHIIDALAGKASGIQVIMPSGKPQGNSFIRIRGTTSIDASSEPLYVIDGVPTHTIYDISPNDVESVSVLKDASAAAIYGSAGSNGVVIINTKKENDSKGVVNFNSYYGFSKVTNKLETLNSIQYIDLMEELGLTTDWSKYTENTNWQDEIYRTATKQNYQLSFAGSDKGYNYYISGNWQKFEGIIRNSTADRLSGKVNFDKEVNKWLKVGASLMYSKWHDVNVSDNIGSGNQGVVLGALITPPVIGVINDDGTYTGNPLQPSWENPVAGTDAAENNYHSNRFLSNFFYEIQIIRGLKYKSSLSLDNFNGKYTYFLDPYTTDWGRVNIGMAQETNDASSFWIYENLLTYDKIKGENKFSLMGGVIVSKNSTSSLSVEARNFANESIKSINGGSEVKSALSFEEHRSNVSILSRVNYAYNDKYLFTVNARADASSVFGPAKRWGFFPSFSGGWRITKESFMENQYFFNEIKLRLGWGEVGNDRISPYAWSGKVGPGYNYVINGQIVPGIAIETFDNKDLQWETTSQTNMGIDITFFKYRLNLIADAYIKNTSNLLLSVPIPTYTGFSSTIQNVGKIQNKGLEFAVSAKIIDAGFIWDVNYNMSFNKNRVIDLKDQVIMTGYIFQRGNVVRVEEGKELGNFWGHISEGVDPVTGNIIYKDIDNDNAFTAEGDKTIIGNANPDFICGLTNTISYKGISLNVFLQGVYGNQVFNATRIYTEGMNDFKNQTSDVLRRWHNEGDITDIPKSTLGLKNNSELSTRFIEDGSYLRVKTITLSYFIPEKLLKKVNIAKLKVYATAENLFTFTNYSGYDPELNAFGNNNLVQSVDIGTYPHARSVILGLNVSF